jgi:ferritin-like metal-binding protein YciE
VSMGSSRTLVVQLLGELLYVERRLADDVLGTLATSVSDHELKAALREHREETAAHRERLESAFMQLEIAATSNRVPQFEQLVDHHEELAGSVAAGPLQDLVHAQAALETEHWEIARYQALLPLVPAEIGKQLRPSLASEKGAADVLCKTIERLTAQAASRRA